MGIKETGIYKHVCIEKLMSAHCRQHNTRCQSRQAHCRFSAFFLRFPPKTCLCAVRKKKYSDTPCHCQVIIWTQVVMTYNFCGGAYSGQLIEPQRPSAKRKYIIIGGIEQCQCQTADTDAGTKRLCTKEQDQFKKVH